MTDFSLDLNGIEQAIDEIDETIEELQTAQRYVVGTGVEYAIYLEGGTSKMDAKPFFQPAINEVRIQGVDGFIRHNTRTSVEQLDTTAQVLRVLAVALERRVKEIITQKSLIDTGTLRASVLAVPGADPSALPDEGEFSGFDSDNPAPPTAGRAVASETIDINV
jgi:hypothetical protein